MHAHLWTSKEKGPRLFLERRELSYKTPGGKGVQDGC